MIVDHWNKFSKTLNEQNVSSDEMELVKRFFFIGAMSAFIETVEATYGREKRLSPEHSILFLELKKEMGH